MIWRYLLAIALSMLVVILWGYFVPRPPAPQTPQGARQEAPAAAVPGAQAPPKEAKPSAPQAEVAPPRPEREHRELEVRVGEHLLAVVDSLDGVFSKVFLPGFHETVDTKEPYQLLFPLVEEIGTLGLEVEKLGLKTEKHPIPRENWELHREEAGPEAGAVVLENTVDGIRIRKTILAPQGGAAPGEEPYDLSVRLELENLGAEPLKLRYKLYGPCAIDTESLRTLGDDLSLVCGQWVGGKTVNVTVLETKKLKSDYWELGERVAWVGASNNYFATLLVPRSVGGNRLESDDLAFASAYPDRESLRTLAQAGGRKLEELRPADLEELKKKAYKNLRVGLRTDVSLAPGERFSRDYMFFAGPRDSEVLNRYAELNFSGVNDYGTFGFLVKLFNGLLGLLRRVAFGNWGAAILLLTFLVKLCLHPINKRSQGSMQRFSKKMQRIKPQMDELKQRYGDNRLKLQQETAKLWKENEINPGQQMGGCLVLFLQLPIWIALYSTLQYALGLRQAGFLYVKDLTRPDQLFHLGLHLPVLGEFFEWFNLLPILYVILTVVNQSLQPKPDDPQMRAQFRMMTFMLVFFGFIFYHSPAGFMLYIMTSSALGIIESKIIKAELAREERGDGTAAPVSGKGSGGGPRTGESYYPARVPKAGKLKRK